MTRQFHKPLRTPKPYKLGFTCFRLVPFYDGQPGEPAYATVELEDTSNAMRAFVDRPVRARKRAA